MFFIIDKVQIKLIKKFENYFMFILKKKKMNEINIV